MSVIVWVLGALAAGIIADEFLGWVTPTCRALLRRGAQRLPAGWSERYAEEWQAELLAKPDAPISRTVWTVHTLLGVWTLRQSLVGRSPAEPVITTPELPVTTGGLTITEPAVRQIALGAQLRRLRTDRGITPDGVTSALHISREDLRRLELGQARISDQHLQSLLRLYAVTNQGDLALYRHLGQPDDHRGWWHRYADLPSSRPMEILEDIATMIRSYDPLHVPDLLQTPAYARWSIWCREVRQFGGRIDQPVENRLSRQTILTRAQPTRLWAIIGETALRRPVHRCPAIREQLEHLIEATYAPNITLQILPESDRTVSTCGAFRLLRFAHHELPDIVCAEQLTSTIYLDDSHDVDRYTGQLEELSLQAIPVSNTRRYLQHMLETLNQPHNTDR